MFCPSQWARPLCLNRPRSTSPLSSPSPSTPHHYSTSSNSSTGLGPPSDHRTRSTGAAYVGKMAAHARSGSASSAGSHVLQRGNRSLAASTSQPSKQAPPSPPSRPTHTHLTPSLSRRRSHLQLSFQPLAITVDADVDDRKLPSQPHTAHPMSSVELASYRAFLAKRAEDCAKDRIAFASIDQLHPNKNPPPRVNADHAFLDDADSDFSWEAASFMSAPSNQTGSAVQGTAVEVPQHA